MSGAIRDLSHIMEERVSEQRSRAFHRNQLSGCTTECISSTECCEQRLT